MKQLYDDHWCGFASRRHDEIPDKDLHRFPILIERRRSDLDQPLVGPRLRRPHFKHLAFKPQHIARTHRAGPAELFKASSDNPASGPKLALNEQPHRYGRGVPSARRQTTKNGVTRRLLIEMEGLRIELRSESLDAFFNRTRFAEKPPSLHHMDLAH
jgi:hypothetical protein